MLGCEFVRSVGIHGEKIVFAVNLHAMTSKKEQPDVFVNQSSLEALKRTIQVDVWTISNLVHFKSAGLEFGRYIVRVVAWIFEHATINIS